MDAFVEDVIQGHIVLVTGGSRGIGKGVALMLGKAGATVYISGRTLHASERCTGSLMETANEIRAIGGHCIPVQCDHTSDEEVRRLFDRINKEQDGRLDILVNCAFGGTEYLSQHGGKPFHMQPIEAWDHINSVGLRSNYISSWYAARIMVKRNKGMIVNVSGPTPASCNTSIPFAVGKEANDKMIIDMAKELAEYNVACIPLWPGFVRTESIINFLENNKDKADAAGFGHLLSESEDPTFTGKAVVAMTKDPNIMKKSGHVQIVAELALEYNFLDVGGKQPLSCRQLKYMTMYYHPWLAAFVPNFIYVPKWLLTLATHKF